MDEHNFLPHFISEEIYLLDESPSSLERKTIVMVDGPMSDADKQFLLKIFSAVSISPQQLIIYETSHTPDVLAGEIFYFGNTPEKAEMYQVTPQGEVQIIYCHSLSELAADQDQKRKLWEVLKEVYPTPEFP